MKMSTQLSSGVTVAAVDVPSPLVHLGVAVKSGSRYETYENQGVANAMRVAYGLSTQNMGAVTLNRSIGQMGTSLMVEQDREYTLFKTVVLRDKAPEALDFLLESVAHPKFKPWEINDQVFDLKDQLLPTNPSFKRYFTRLEVDLALATRKDRVVDLLHKAAYRQGLGNFRWAQKFALGRHDSAMLKAFHSQTVTAPRTSVLAVGLDVETLASMSQTLSLESGSGPSNQAQYYGGEQREDDLGNQTVVALAGQTCGFSGKESGANMVLAHILSSQSIKRGLGVGKLDKAVGEIAKVSLVQHVYTDSGLLGALIECHPNQAGEAISSLAATLRSGDVTAEEVNAAKATLLTNSLSYLESGANRLRSMGWQTAALGSTSVSGEDAFATMIQSVSVGDVQAAAKKLSSGKLSMGAAGNLSQVPYLDTL
eukprot:TCALIF_07917-PA protein Name:"Similar to UQCRC2 Cytochrome b-c1 complex subunit 2, mitochondrial (Bos taurus)" AED:0.13 eAED:0.13 QI:0/0.75/0.8/0.8/1/1/5/295/424